MDVSGRLALSQEKVEGAECGVTFLIIKSEQ